MKPASQNKISVGIADDHTLLRNGLAGLIESFDDYHVVFEAGNGADLQDQTAHHGYPDLVLLDINMPKMDGFATAQWLKQTAPQCRVLALSMYDDETSIIRMFKAGARGYILKDCEPAELKCALASIIQKGYYYSELVTGKLIHTINNLDAGSDLANLIRLNEREVEFLKLACTEMTYHQIADSMFLSPRTIDGYRDNLLHKLDLKTRIGLVTYAIRNGIVQL